MTGATHTGSNQNPRLADFCQARRILISPDPQRDGREMMGSAPDLRSKSSTGAQLGAVMPNSAQNPSQISFDCPKKEARLCTFHSVIIYGPRHKRPPLGEARQWGFFKAADERPPS